MSSRSLYIGLFLFAGLNLSFWGSPLQARELTPRIPVSSQCSNVIATNIAENITNFSCSNKETHSGIEAISQIQSSGIYEEDEQGNKVLKNLTVTVSTETNSRRNIEANGYCEECDDLSSDFQSTTLVFTADDLKQPNSIQNQILQAAYGQEDQGIDAVRDGKNLAEDIAACKVDSSGERLGKEDRFDCHIEKLADLDDEEAEEYFSKYLKDDLAQKAMSLDSDERAAALQALERIDEVAYSDKILNDVNAMQTASRQAQTVSQHLDQAQILMKQASLSQNAQQQQYFQNMASQLLKNAETGVQQLQMRAVGTNFEGYMGTLAENLTQAATTSQELSLLKAQNLNGVGSTVGSVDNAMNSSRYARAGGNAQTIPGGLVTTLPQITGNPPSNSSQLNLPNATRIGQNRMPVNQAPFNGMQQQMIPQIQPMPQQNMMMGQQQQVYNPMMPMGNQFQNAPMAGMVPY